MACARKTFAASTALLVGLGLGRPAAARADPQAPVELELPEASPRTLVGDWEPPQAVVVAFTDGWPKTTASLLASLSRHVPVLVLLEDGQRQALVDAVIAGLRLPHADRIVSTALRVDSTWTRDYAPLQVWDRERGLVWLDSPYDDLRPLDDAVPLHLGRWAGIPLEEMVHSIDGGAIASNGDGLCVSTLEYFDHADIDWQDPRETRPLMAQIGCLRLVLVHALVHEPTRHIDTFMQFVEPTVLVAAAYDPDRDPVDAVRVDEAVTAVRRAASAMGIRLRVVRVPAPSPRGRTYPTYTNFLRLADAVLVPSYAEVVAPEEERAALDGLARAMPAIPLVPVPADVPNAFGGSIHCLTWGLLRK